MNKFLSLGLLPTAVTAAFIFSGCPASKPDKAQAVPSLPKIDMTTWSYNADDDVYYQTGISYAATPLDSDYESMGIFVPGAYFSGSDNGNGTFTVTVNKNGKSGGFKAANAPTVILVETPGYSACNPPSGYVSSVKDFTDAGFIYIYPGCRGRNHGAPAGVTDLKAAIRYWRYNLDSLPGNTDRIFSFGMSGGGAQSALLGATGNAPEYEPYLNAIGAVQGVSDAVTGSMCWCPITNLDIGDASYEWNMASSRSGLDDVTQQISDGLSETFAEYVNSLGLKDEKGNVLTLEKSDEGIYKAGSYYEYVKAFIEKSLNNFLSDTTFPYDSSASQGGFGGPGGMGGMMGGGMPPMGGMPPADGNMPPMGGQGGLGDFGGGAGGGQGAQDYTQMDNIQRTSNANSGVTISGVYETAQDYIDALNANGTWVTYDAKTNTAKITSIDDFARNVKTATKSSGAFDDLNATQGENTLFGYNDGKGAHFDKYLAEIVKGTKYEGAYVSDLAKTDSLGTSVEARLNMYTPTYYLNQNFAGYKTSDVAKYWRIRSGIFQGDTAVNTELNLALSLKNYGIKNVDLEAVWGQKHVKAERKGDSTANFIAWVKECLK